MDETTGSVAALAMASSRQVFGAQVVSKTLDYMNRNQNMSGGGNADYDFQTSVLGAAYAGKGTMVDMMV
ncbi:MAG: hypothetical protein AB1916_07800 [Thermodesulfobacteriota bacterium]